MKMLSHCAFLVSKASPTRLASRWPQNALKWRSVRSLSTSDEYDYIVIGGGSGGMASARRAAAHGAKVALVEAQALGGTCVNVGCVPKKLMWHAADLMHNLQYVHEYGIQLPPPNDEFAKPEPYLPLPEAGPPPKKPSPPQYSYEWKYDLASFKRTRDLYIQRLNAIYLNNLRQSGITLYHGYGSLAGNHSVSVKGTEQSDRITKVYEENLQKSVNGGASRAMPDTKIPASGETVNIHAKHVLLAPGGQPHRPEIPGAELGIDSNGFFELSSLPQRIAVVGAGYIATELAGVLKSLGSDVTMVTRHDTVLRRFDDMIAEHITNALRHQGIKFKDFSEPKSLTRDSADGKLQIAMQDGSVLGEQDCVLFATGRTPLTEGLNLKQNSVEVDGRGYICVDELQNTTCKGVYALGDVTGQAELTPVAIAAGRLLSDRLFGGANLKSAKLDYNQIPTVVFSHPPVGCVGLTEAEARAKYSDIKVYTSTFIPLFYGVTADKPQSKVKLICQGRDERIVGLHIVGTGSDEMLQGFAVAIKMGATKRDFDSSVAIHPTAAEELVTIPHWQPHLH